MRKELITNLQEYLKIVVELKEVGYDFILFRGQSDDSPLIPSIARLNPKNDSTPTEIEMIQYLRRVGFMKLGEKEMDDWDLLVYAQHYGMKTRLLDWSSNPLTALWFAIENEYKSKQPSFVYILFGDSKTIIDKEKDKSPFKIRRTRVLAPNLNNERILAQAGWFTAHRYSTKDNCFVSLEKNSDVKNQLIQIEIPSDKKETLLRMIAILGANARTLFPDFVGLCKHINWKYRRGLK